MNASEMRSKIIVALDGMDKQEVIALLNKSREYFSYYKIGLELFCRYGKDLVQQLQNDFNINVFLDLKLHDIPKTVEKAIYSLEGLNIDLLTLHLTGGREMIEMASDARDKAIPNANLLGVTYLTSLSSSDVSEIWKDHKMNISGMVEYAQKTKIDGLVMGGSDLSSISADGLLKVTPGIRLSCEISDGQIQDQKRVTTPKKAFEDGASYLVMGRSITLRKDLSEFDKLLLED